MSQFGFKKSDWLEDWYTLECGLGGTPEGTAEEWRAIVQAIRERRGQGFRRVGVSLDAAPGWFQICSPRNCYGDRDHMPLPFESAEEFCREVEAVLAIHDAEYTLGGVI